MDFPQEAFFWPLILLSRFTLEATMPVTYRSAGLTGIRSLPI